MPDDAQRRHLGRALRDARVAKRLTQARVAKLLGCSQGRVQKIEAGLAPITPAELETLFQHYDIPEPSRADLLALTRADAGYRGKVAKSPRWPAYGQLKDLEQEASEIRCLHSDRIPGTLQSEHYMLQIMSEVFGEVEVTEVIKERRRRAQILTSGGGPRYRVILSESSALRGVRGRPEILIDQIEHLLMLMETCSSLDLQILPLESAQLFVDSDFWILHFADGRGRDFAYVEGPGGAHTFKAREDIAHFDEHWDRLHTTALSIADTYDYLRRLVNLGTRNTKGSSRD